MTTPQVTPGVALITGATSGIGEAFARAMPATTSLLLTGRTAETLDRLSRELSTPDRKVDTVVADLCTDEGLDAVCAAAERAGIDLLVCNAGVGPYGEFLVAEEGMLRQTVQLNVVATTMLCRRLLPGMLQRAEAGGQKAGLIIVASNMAFVPVPQLATYAATKAFELSLGESLAAELSSRPVAVLTLCPTMTRSRFARRSGFGPTPPMAQRAPHVARKALAALGKQHTLVLGPLSGPLLWPPAMARAAFAHLVHAVLPRR